jgi:ACT domain-containing protein
MFMVIVLKYDKADQAKIEDLVEGMSKPSNESCAQVKCVYQGSNQKVISALESVLSLSE